MLSNTHDQRLDRSSSAPSSGILFVAGSLEKRGATSKSSGG